MSPPLLVVCKFCGYSRAFPAASAECEQFLEGWGGLISATLTYLRVLVQTGIGPGVAFSLPLSGKEKPVKGSIDFVARGCLCDLSSVHKPWEMRRLNSESRGCPLPLLLPKHVVWATSAYADGPLANAPWSARSRSVQLTGLSRWPGAINRICPLWRCWSKHCVRPQMTFAPGPRPPIFAETRSDV